MGIRMFGCSQSKWEEGINNIFGTKEERVGMTGTSGFSGILCALKLHDNDSLRKLTATLS
jgi:hypothetical protein